MKKTLLTLLLIVCCGSALAIDIKIKQDSTKQQKYSLFFTGRIDTYGYFDSYTNVDSQNGLVYYMPSRPVYDSETGADLNFNEAPTTRFSIAATRLALGGAIQFNEQNSAEGYVELDFLGTNTNVISTFRLRHAYAKLNLGNSSILFGQTSHLIVCDENLPGVVSSGVGFPYSITTRPVQFRFSQKLFNSALELSAAASMYGSSELDYQSRAVLPDFSLRARYGDAASNNIALVGGYRSLKVGDDSERMNAFYAGVSAKLDIQDGYVLRGMAAYGADMSVFTVLGGYASSASTGELVPLNSMTAYLDFSTPRFGGFEFGAFYGYQTNLGANEMVDLNSVVSSPVEALNLYWSVAPRVMYHYRNFTFGLEYTFTQANWMKDESTGLQSNEYYVGQGAGVLSNNSRYTILCRFTF